MRRSTIAIAVVLAAWSVASTDDRPVIDPAVRAAVAGAHAARVLVELHGPGTDPASITQAQDEVLRRLAGTGARPVRRYATAPLLALEIDAAALARLEEMRGLVTRVRADQLVPPYEGPRPSR
jgi:hypothetical protein